MTPRVPGGAFPRCSEYDPSAPLRLGSSPLADPPVYSEGKGLYCCLYSCLRSDFSETGVNVSSAKDLAQANQACVSFGKRPCAPTPTMVNLARAERQRAAKPHQAGAIQNTTARLQL